MPAVARLKYTAGMNDQTAASLLESIESPADLRALPQGDLAALAAELREFLIHSV